MSAKLDTILASWGWSRGQLLAVLAIVIFAVVGGLLVEYEPRGPQSCDNVQILGVTSCGRGGQCFAVRYLNTAERRLVGTFAKKPFDVDYRGPAALLMTKGKWIDSLHFEFRVSCNSPQAND
jgi:hypothetical protein